MENQVNQNRGLSPSETYAKQAHIAHDNAVHEVAQKVAKDRRRFKVSVVVGRLASISRIFHEISQEYLSPLEERVSLDLALANMEKLQADVRGYREKETQPTVKELVAQSMEEQLRRNLDKPSFQVTSCNGGGDAAIAKDAAVERKRSHHKKPAPVVEKRSHKAKAKPTRRR